MVANVLSLLDLFDDWKSEVGEKGFFNPSAILYDNIIDKTPPIVESILSENKDFVEIQLKERDDISRYSGSLISNLIPLPRSYILLKNFIHNFTFQLWAQATDIALSRHFPDLPYDQGVLTPDFIYEDEESVLVVEFVTCNSPHDRIVRDAYIFKQNKYLEAIQSGSALKPNKVVFFGIVAVGYKLVVSNLNLNRETLQELILRNSVARTIFHTLKIQGLVTDEIVLRTPDELKLLEFLHSIPIDAPNMTGEFSVENYHRLLEREESANAAALFRQCMGLASMRLDSEIRNKITKKEEAREAIDVEWQAYERAYLNSNAAGLTYHQKSVVNCPEVPPAYDARPSFSIADFINRVTLDSGILNETYQAWVSAIGNFEYGGDGNATQYDDDLAELQEEELLSALEELKMHVDLKYSEAGAKRVKKERRMYNRVQLGLNQDDWVNLAKVGINGKSFKDHPEVSQYRKEKKKPMALDIDTTDLEAFISGEHSGWFNPDAQQDYLPASIYRNLELIKRADDMHPSRDLFNQYYTFLSDIVRTKFYKWSKFISDVATEVAVSFKQHCGKNEFVMKKVKDWDALLLIKPTRSGSHCFFSILALGNLTIEESEGNVFRKWHTDGRLSWTDFISLDKSKISNWVLAESRVVCMFAYWTEAMKCEPFCCSTIRMEDEYMKRENEQPFIEAYKMLWISTLIGLADKAEVEETCSLSRFIVMESFVNPPIQPKPEKMVEKFPLRCRSRMTVWVVHKLRQLCVHSKLRPIRIEPTDGIDIPGCSSTDATEQLTWSGFVNWFTGASTSDPGLVVNLMYIGYIKNKHQDGEVNAESKLLDKILTLEEKLTEPIKGRIGRENKEFNSGTFHEWNIDGLKYCCNLVKTKLNREVGKDIEQVLSKELEARLVSASVEDSFMTLKASSNFDDEWLTYAEYSSRIKESRQQTKAEQSTNYPAKESENFNSHQFYFRSKVLEKSAQYVVGDKTKLIDILPDCFHEITQRGAMRICIFKKQQHGGLREIYVLNFAERVVQFVLELAGRVLCEFFTGETMTHPNAKKYIMESHQGRVRQRGRNKQVYTTYTSADSAKWSQNQYCNKLASVLLAFFPQQWHGFIFRAMELWRHKQIKLSDDLLYLMHCQDGLAFWDETTDKIYKAYRGLDPQPWMIKGQSCVTTQSGMMQGILHYVSSAFHSVVNTAVVLLLERWVQSLDEGMFLVSSVYQSSDDSGLMLSFCYDDRVQVQTVLRLSAICHYFKAIFSEEMAIKDSIKTTFNCGHVFEFNSKFYFGDQLYEPDIKQSYAANMVSEQESLIERQEEAYTLLSGFISAGGSFYAAKFLQYSQALFYYRTLGCTVSNNFKLLSNALLKLPDPSLGFFLLDHSSCVGLTGFSFNHWNCVKNSRLGGFYASQLNAITQNRTNRDPSLNLQDLIEVLPSGAVLRRVRTSWGNSVKLNKLKKRLCLDEEWVNTIDSKPDLLFRNADTTDEYKLKISLKLSQKGVSTSLSTGVPVTSIIAASLYSIQDRVFFLSEETGDEELKPSEYQGTIRNKISLAELLLCSLKLAPSALTDEQEALLFPLHKEFYRIKEEMDSIRHYQYMRKFFHRRRITTTITVFETDGTGPISIVDLVRTMWYPYLKVKHNLRYPMELLRPKMENLKSQIRWLADTPQESLSRSPFDHMHQMVNWFRSLEEKKRNVTFLGVPLVSKKGRTTHKSVMINNFHKHMKLTILLNQTEAGPRQLSAQRTAIKSLLTCLTYPWRTEDRNRNVTNLLSSLASVLPYNPNQQKSRLNSLKIICEAVRGSPVVDIISMINRNKLGHVGFWEEPQTCVDGRYGGPGKWVGAICGVETTITVAKSTYDGKTRIKTIFTRVVADNELEDWARGLKMWELENHVDSREEIIHPKPHLVYRNGRVYASDIGHMIHKTLNVRNYKLSLGRRPALVVDYPSLQDMSTKDRVYIRLRFNARDDPRDYTLLSFGISHLDWDSEPIPVPAIPNLKEAEKKWLSVQGLGPVQAARFLLASGDYTKKITQLCLRGQFELSGITLPSAVRVVEPIARDTAAVATNPDLEDEEMLALLDECISSFALAGSLAEPQAVELCSSHGQDDGDAWEAEEDWLVADAALAEELVGTFEYERTERPVRKPILRAICESHPLLKCVVVETITRSSRAYLLNVLRSGRYYFEDERWVSRLALAFPEKTFELIQVQEPGVDSDAESFEDLV